MRFVRALSVALTVTMLATIAYGFRAGGFAEEGSQILELPWGRVTLIDLYVGVIIFGTWIAVRETSWLARVGWWASLVVLGNLAAAVYLMVASFTSDDADELMFGV